MSKGSKQRIIEDDDLESEVKICQNSAHFASNISKNKDTEHIKNKKSEESLQFINLKVVHEDFTTFRDDNQKAQID